MIQSVPEVTASSVTVIDANGMNQSIPIRLTPRRRFLTQATKRAILATGFLLRYGEDLATDQVVINSVLEGIRQECLQHHGGAER